MSMCRFTFQMSYQQFMCSNNIFLTKTLKTSSLVFWFSSFLTAHISISHAIIHLQMLKIQAQILLAKHTGHYLSIL